MTETKNKINHKEKFFYGLSNNGKDIEIIKPFDIDPNKYKLHREIELAEKIASIGRDCFYKKDYKYIHLYKEKQEYDNFISDEMFSKLKEQEYFNFFDNDFYKEKIREQLNNSLITLYKGIPLVELEILDIETYKTMTFEELARQKSRTENYYEARWMKDAISFMHKNKDTLKTDFRTLIKYFRKELIPEIKNIDKPKRKVFKFIATTEITDKFNLEDFICEYLDDQERKYFENIVEDELNKLNIKVEKESENRILKF